MTAVPLNVAIVIFDGAEELDFVGPWEVLTMVNPVLDGMGASLGQGSAPRLNCFFVSEKGGTTKASKGMRLLADHSFADCPRPDIILVPGGQGTRREVENPAMLGWIAKVAPGCKFVTSVCTGSLLLGAAGPAKGKTVTTYWAFVKTLKDRGDVKDVRDDVRFVRDGNVITSAGVSAGIDMSLYLVGQIYTPAFARAVQKAMEYFPAPPYTAEI